MTEQSGNILLLGATGTIGRATFARLQAEGHAVTCLTRPGGRAPDGAAQAEADFSDPADLRRAVTASGARAIMSCMASRTGQPADAWAIDHRAHLHVLEAAKSAGVAQFVLLSAICVQKPHLEFQRAKLAFEGELQRSGLIWSIVRPTAFFKSLSGQVARVQVGKPFLLFGDGTLTACKPISDRDLAAYLVACLSTSAQQNCILPIGGPGPALTPRAQGEMLFELLGQPPRFRSVPVGLMAVIVGLLSGLGRISRTAREKAEFARIGQYYATESMLVWDAAHGVYDADATPETGQDTLRDHYEALIRGEVATDLGDHAAF